MAAITLLLSLFEGHMNVQLVQTLTQSLRYKPMIALMDATYREWADEHGIRDSENAAFQALDEGKELLRGIFLGLEEEDEFKDTLNLACSVFIFLKSTLDIQALVTSTEHLAATVVEERFADKDSITVKEALRPSTSYRRINRKVAAIEILCNGTLERVYFRIPSISVRNLKKASRSLLIKDVERSGDTARLRDFFERCFVLMNEIEFYEQMRSIPALSIVHKYSEWFDILSILIAFVLNGVMLFSVDYTNLTPSNVEQGPTERAYRGLGIVQIVLQSILLINFFVGPARIRISEKWEEWQEEQNQGCDE